jgi:hypothetical protein
VHLLPPNIREGGEIVEINDMTAIAQRPLGFSAIGAKTRLQRYSSGIPATRRPAKYVASTKPRIFGTPQGSTARKRAMLE